jgi:hypothetical protein
VLISNTWEIYPRQENAPLDLWVFFPQIDFIDDTSGKESSNSGKSALRFCLRNCMKQMRSGEAAIPFHRNA